MPSTQRTASVGAVAAALVLAYAVLVAGQILLGVLVAGSIYATALLVTVASPDGVVTDMGEGRAAVTAFLGVGVAGYALVVASALLYGLLGALLVFLGSWLTAPNGPLVRPVRCLLAARDDLREVRDAVVADDVPSSDD